AAPEGLGQFGSAGVPPPPPPPPPGGPGVGGRLPTGPDGFPRMPAGRGGMMIMMMPGRLRMQANQQTTQQIADMLSNQLSRPVLDETGLKGKFDITLTFQPENGMG